MPRVSAVVRLGIIGCFLSLAAMAQGAPMHVIHISVDGLGSTYLQTLRAGGEAPNFARIMTRGTGTLNARNDYDYTVTLPNHTSMVTGRAVIGVSGNGHGWTGNSDPAVGSTIYTNKGAYIASVFDVVHDHGLRTGVYVGKTKFSLFRDSYNATNGAPDTIGADNGRNKIDSYVYDASSSAMTSSFIAAMNANPFHYSFVHFADPDAAGHDYNWGSPEYYAAVKAVDALVGDILDMVEANAALKDSTALILTADHGGNGGDHSLKTDPLNYTIPFYVSGPGVIAGSDLYALNALSRSNPGTSRPDYAVALQPVRNGDGANVALDLLGLESVPGSTVNFNQSLLVPDPSGLSALGLMGILLARRKAR